MKWFYFLIGALFVSDNNNKNSLHTIRKQYFKFHGKVCQLNHPVRYVGSISVGIKFHEIEIFNI